MDKQVQILESLAFRYNDGDMTRYAKYVQQCKDQVRLALSPHAWKVVQDFWDKRYLPAQPLRKMVIETLPNGCYAIFKDGMLLETIDVNIVNNNNTLIEFPISVAGIKEPLTFEQYFARLSKEGKPSYTIIETKHIII